MDWTAQFEQDELPIAIAADVEQGASASVYAAYVSSDREGVDEPVLVKYDNNGTEQWSQRMAVEQFQADELAVDAGVVYFTGYFLEVGDFDGGGISPPMTSYGRADAILARYNVSDGQLLAAQRMGGTGTDRFVGAEIVDGNIIGLVQTWSFDGEYPAGALDVENSSVDNSAFVSPSSESGDMLLMKLDVEAPIVMITSPTPYTIVDENESVTLTATASSGTITWYESNLPISSGNSIEVTPSLGVHQYTAIATDDTDGVVRKGMAGVVVAAWKSTPVAPVASDDDYVTVEDTALTVSARSGVLKNDLDENGDPLTAIWVNDPANGSLALNGNGSFTYHPDAGFSGLDSFTYQASDGDLESNIATVNIMVDPVSDPPIAEDDNYTMEPGGVLTITAPGVLFNDGDPDNEPITAVPWTGTTTNGVQVTLLSDGSFTYTPASDFTGVDTFDYTITDGLLLSDPATVSIRVSLPSTDTPLFVSAISFESNRGDKDWRAVFQIRSDSDGDGVGELTDDAAAGVAITVEFAGRSFTGVTDSDGIFRTDWVRNLKSGSYGAEVVDLALANYYWDPLEEMDLEDDSDGDGLPDNVLYR